MPSTPSLAFRFVDSIRKNRNKSNIGMEKTISKNELVPYIVG